EEHSQVRLEEWQKFIEAQFLDDTPEPAKKPEPPVEEKTPISASVSVPVVPLPAHADVQSARDGSDHGEKNTESVSAEAPLRLVFEDEPTPTAEVTERIEE